MHFMRRKADAEIPFGEGSCISISKFSLQRSDLLAERFVGRRWGVASTIAFAMHVVFLSLNRRLLQLVRLVQYLIDVSYSHSSELTSIKYCTSRNS